MEKRYGSSLCFLSFFRSHTCRARKIVPALECFREQKMRSVFFYVLCHSLCLSPSCPHAQVTVVCRIFSIGQYKQCITVHAKLFFHNSSLPCTTALWRPTQKVGCCYSRAGIQIDGYGRYANEEHAWYNHLADLFTLF